MKLAIKLGAEKESYAHLKKIVEQSNLDFIELMPLMDGEYYKKFKEFNLPVIIHAPHDSLGATPSDPTKYERTIKCFEESQRIADFFNSEYIIVHPGRYIQEISSKEARENAIKVFSKINDRRILLENLIWLDEYVHDFCSNAREMKEMMEKLGYTKFCLDFAHMTLTEKSRKEGYQKVAQEFMELKPDYFHICGGDFRDHKTEHSSIFYGDFDIPFFKNLIPSEGMLVFETPKEPIERRINEIKYFRSEIEFYRV